jgi:antitoxin CptB
MTTGDATPDASASGGDDALSAVELGRLRWRCRRGMLENDLVLGAFLERRGAAIRRDEALLLSRLLDLADNDLWDVFCGRRDAPDPSTRPMVDELRVR